MTTLANLVSDLVDELKYDPQKAVNSNALLQRNLNRALRRIQEDSVYGLPENQEVVVVNTSAGTQEYTLPADFIKVGEPDSVKIDNSTPLQAEQYNILLQRFDMTNQGKPCYYYIRKEGDDYKLGFYPTPAASYAVTFPYLRYLPEMTDSVGSPLPVDYDEAMVLYAVYITNRRIIGFEQKAAEYKAMYDDLIRKIKATRQGYDRHALRFGYERTRAWGYSDKAVYPNYY